MRGVTKLEFYKKNVYYLTKVYYRQFKKLLNVLGIIIIFISWLVILQSIYIIYYAIGTGKLM